jgi:hypothetical protein
MEQMKDRGLLGPTEWYAERGGVSPYKSSGHPAEHAKLGHWSILCARQCVLPDLSAGNRGVTRTMSLLLPERYASRELAKAARKGEFEDIYACPFETSWHISFRGSDDRYWSRVVVAADNFCSARRLLLSVLPDGDWEVRNKARQQQLRVSLHYQASKEVKL